MRRLWLTLLLPCAVLAAPTLGPITGFGSMVRQPFPGGEQNQPQLQRLGNGRFLLVYRDTSAHPVWSDIKAAIVDPVTRTGQVIWAFREASEDVWPQLTCDALGCVATWSSYVQFLDESVWLQRFSAADGLPVGAPINVTNGAPGSFQSPSVAIANDAASFVVVWKDGLSVQAVHYDRSGAELSRGPLVSAPFRPLVPRVAAVGDAFVLTFTDELPQNRFMTVRFDRVSGPQPPVLLAANPAGYIVTEVQGGRDGGALGALLTVGTSYGSVRVWPLDALGRPGPESVVCASGCFGRPVLAPLPGSVLALFAREVLSPTFVNQIHGALVLNDGGAPTQLGRLDPTVTSVSAGTGDSIGGLVLLDGGLWLVAADDTSGVGIDLKLGELTYPPLAWTPTEGVRLFDSAPEQVLPTATPHDGGFVVLWFEANGGAGSMELRAAEPSGLATFATGVEAPLALSAESTPAGPLVAWRASDGQGVLVSVAQRRGGTTTVTPLLPSQFAVAGDPVVLSLPSWSWVVFSAAPSSPRAIFASVVPFDGGAPQAPQRLTTPPAIGERVSAAVGDTAVFLAWDDGSSLFGARVDFTGAMLDVVDGGPLATTSVAPSVASNGRDFLVASTNHQTEVASVRIISGATGRQASPTLVLTSAPFDPIGGLVRTSSVWDGLQYLVAVDTMARDGGGAVELFVINADGGLDSRSPIATTPTQEFFGRLATDRHGRSLAAWSAFNPGTDTTEVRVRALTQVLPGRACSAPSECASGVCIAMMCCFADGGCPAALDGGTDAGADGGTSTDAGVDGGTSTDAGTFLDAGDDAGAPIDAGDDAGLSLDAGADAGPSLDADAGPSLDAGADAGPSLDAGADASVSDAGPTDGGPSSFIVGCGCGSSDAGALAWFALAALWVARRVVARAPRL